MENAGTDTGTTAPPRRAVGPILWLRENLLSSRTNAVLTLLALWLIYQLAATRLRLGGPARHLAGHRRRRLHAPRRRRLLAVRQRLARAASSTAATPTPSAGASTSPTRWRWRASPRS